MDPRAWWLLTLVKIGYFQSQISQLKQKLIKVLPYDSCQRCFTVERLHAHILPCPSWHGKSYRPQDCAVVCFQMTVHICCVGISLLESFNLQFLACLTHLSLYLSLSHTHTCVRTHTHTYTHTHSETVPHMHTHRHMHHTLIHIHTYTHTHSLTRM